MRKFLSFMSLTLLGQIISAITGLLLTRWLSIGDYAIYTIFLTISGAIQVLTKGGVHLGLNAVIGQAWPDKIRVKSALNVAIDIRRKISFYILPAIGIYAVWLLYQINTNIIIMIVLLVLLVFNWIGDLKTRVVDSVLMHDGYQTKIQFLDASISVFRFLIIVIVYSFGLVNVLTAAILSVLPALLRIPKITTWINKTLECKIEDCSDNPYKMDRERINEITKRQFPMEFFYCFQAPFLLFILSFFSNSSDVASLGALSRIGQLFLPITAILMSFAVPSFVKAKKKIGFNLLLWSLFALVPGIGLVVISIFFPKILLFLVGQNYQNLEMELVIACISFSANLLASFIWQLIAHRGWNYFVYVQIPIVILWCVITPLFINVTTLIGVLWFQLGFPLGILASCIVDILAAKKRGDFCGDKNGK